jgi:hypothetical protein
MSLQTENSRRVAKSRPVCMGLYDHIETRLKSVCHLVGDVSHYSHLLQLVFKCLDIWASRSMELTVVCSGRLFIK